MFQVSVALSVFLFLLLCTRKSPGKGVNPTAEMMVITEEDDGGTFGDIPAKRIVRASNTRMERKKGPGPFLFLSGKNHNPDVPVDCN